MALARTSYLVQGTANASHAIGMLAVRGRQVRPGNWSAPEIFGRLLAAIVNVSDHPCWRTNDVATQLALLAAPYRSRLLDSGRVTRKR